MRLKKRWFIFILGHALINLVWDSVMLSQWSRFLILAYANIMPSSLVLRSETGVAKLVTIMKNILTFNNVANKLQYLQLGVYLYYCCCLAWQTTLSTTFITFHKFLYHIFPKHLYAIYYSTVWIFLFAGEFLIASTIPYKNHIKSQ
jgi:hypothetical protein